MAPGVAIEQFAALTDYGAAVPHFTFSHEARRFLLERTYGRSFPSPDDAGKVPLVVWTLSSKYIGVDGSTVGESGPRYQLFVERLVDIASDPLAELDAGKPIAFRLAPNLPKAPSYFVSLSDGQLSIQPA